MNADDREDRFAPGKLWSLLEMISLDASLLQPLIVWTTTLETSLSMQTFHQTGRGKTITLYGVQFENTEKQYADHIAELYRIGLTSSAKGLERVRD